MVFIEFKNFLKLGKNWPKTVTFRKQIIIEKMGPKDGIKIIIKALK